MKDHKQIGRLAIRDEGEWINAYYAMPGTMDGSILLASLRRTAADRPGVFDAFKDLGRTIVGEILFEEIGARPAWGGEDRAPEHERAGKA